VLRAFGAAIALALACLGPSLAQEQPLVSPILTLDQERLFEGSGVAARVSAEVAKRSRELAQENARIVEELGAEEVALTEQRADLEPDVFRAMADAFDEKVQRLRAEQDAKEVALQRLRDQEQQNFIRQITPVIAAIVRERGALIVIDRRAAILSADAIDVTDEAIARVKAALDAQNAVNPSLEVAPEAPPQQP